MNAETIKALESFCLHIGLPGLCILLFWFERFMQNQRIIENNSKVVAIFDKIERDGVKCRHE